MKQANAFVGEKIPTADLLCTMQASLALEPFSAALAREMKEPYHIRVCIPCYKEPLELLQLTVTGALRAALPQKCRRTVYLCDDGKDEEKQKWYCSKCYVPLKYFAAQSSTVWIQNRSHKLSDLRAECLYAQ